jgi:two-component system sensor histidine kinase HydH
MNSSSSSVHQRFLRNEQQRLFGKLVGVRVMVLPLFASAILSLAWVEADLWRSLLLVAIAFIGPTFFLVELLRYRKFGLTPHAVPRNVVLSVLGQLTVSTVTGGLLSPFIYGLLPIAGVLGALMDRRSYSILTALQLTGIWCFAVLGASDLAPNFSAIAALGNPNFPAVYFYTHAVVLTLLVLSIGQLGRGLSRVFFGTLEGALKAQQEVLTSHAERVRELTGLAAEIAHELKNPLASVKGLAALLAQNIKDERGNERLTVLRREVDRMQSVLEEFLNFSRPLIPLSLVHSDLAQIAREVTLLHEGLSQQRGVQIEFRGEPAEVSCDPRKVKQILINLVQNALDASPRGSNVVVESGQRDGVALVKVSDEGNGIDDALGDVFSPGVTSKAGGAGIGLTIARALARQHGGELTLSQRAERASNQSRGSVATLSLPQQAVPATLTEPV